MAAVKKENDGWIDNDAAEEVSYDSMARGASIIPLGERFTIKRDGTYKFRQYAMGNLLKEGEGLWGHLCDNCVRRWAALVLLPRLLCWKRGEGMGCDNGIFTIKAEDPRVRLHSLSP